MKSASTEKAIREFADYLAGLSPALTVSKVHDRAPLDAAVDAYLGKDDEPQSND